MERPVIVLVPAENGASDHLLKDLLMTPLGWQVLEVQGADCAVQSIRNGRCDMIIVHSAEEDSRAGLDLIRRIRGQDSAVPVFFATRFSTENRVIAALRAGVTDYFRHPVVPAELLESIKRNLPIHAAPQPDGPKTHALVGESHGMRSIKSYIVHVGASDSTVLITGETGTGKELTASLIHQASGRRAKPFVCVNCAALPENLIESEMFGYERGSFTGAVTSSRGRFECAEGGTVFLDEIADMNLHAQAKILRVVENKEVHRLGGKKDIPLDIRIIAATNQDPERLVREGRFREDLFYRLDVARVHLPPLRERMEDLRSLIDHSLAELNRRFGKKVVGLSPEVYECFFRYDWPGNVRELRNLLEAVYIALPSPRIAYKDLPALFRERLAEASAYPLIERARMLSALFETNWNKSKAAQKLNWSRMTLYRKMLKHRIDSSKGHPQDPTDRAHHRIPDVALDKSERCNQGVPGV